MNVTQEASNPDTTPERLEALSQESAALARLVAKNPSAPQRLLREFATSSDEMLCFSVAQNPSTPKLTLFKLGERFPRALIQNPVLSLFLLEDAGLLQWPDKTLLALLSLRELSAGFLEMMSGARSMLVRRRVALHENIERETLYRLLRDESEEVHQSALKSAELPQELRDLFARASASTYNGNKTTYRYQLTLSEMKILWGYGTCSQALVKKHPEATPQIISMLETSG